MLASEISGGCLMKKSWDTVTFRDLTYCISDACWSTSKFKYCSESQYMVVEERIETQQLQPADNSSEFRWWLRILKFILYHSRKSSLSPPKPHPHKKNKVCNGLQNQCTEASTLVKKRQYLGREVPKKHHKMSFKVLGHDTQYKCFWQQWTVLYQNENLCWFLNFWDDPLVGLWNCHFPCF